LKPWGKAKIFDKRITDDKHIMAIDLSKNDMDYASISKLLSANGATEVNDKTL